MNKYLHLLFLAIGCILGYVISGWFEKPCEPAIFSEYHILRDTVYKEVPIPPKVVTVPSPIGVEIPDTPTPPDLDRIRTYKDSTDLAEDFRLYYDITTRGTLERLRFSALDTRPTIIETKIREVAKPTRGLYIGVTAGGNKTSFGTLGAGLDYVNQKNIFGYYFNIIDGSHNIRMSRKVF